MLYWRVLTLPGLLYAKIVCSLIKMKEKSIKFFSFFLEVIKIPIVFLFFVCFFVCDVCNTVNIKVFADAVQIKTIVKA